MTYYAMHLVVLLAAIVTGYPSGRFFRMNHGRR